MGMKPITEDELRYWRIYAALQELCYANDEDIRKDKVFANYLDLNARAIFTFQNRKMDELKLAARAEILKAVGVPVLGKK